MPLTPTEVEVERIDALFPLMAGLGERWARLRPFDGHTIAWNCHLTSLTAVSAKALVRGGGRWFVSEANPATTDAGVARYMGELGMTVLTGMGPGRHRAVLEEGPEILADVGLDLVMAAVKEAPEALAGIQGAIEITASGISRLRGLSVPFPVLNINDGQLKPAIENRHGVGEGTWQALSLITGQHPGGRRAVVVGYGAVGAGVAHYGRAAGAQVEVVEIDPIRRLKAHYDGFTTPSLEEAISRAGLLITATGAVGVVDAELLERAPDGLILANVGHWGDEICRGDLEAQGPGATMGPHLERFQLPGGKGIYLVARGEPVNIVLNTGSPEPTLLHLALEGLSIEHLLAARGLAPGELLVPASVERLAAQLALTALGVEPQAAR